jgi:hypothetical protein
MSGVVADRLLGIVELGETFRPSATQDESVHLRPGAPYYRAWDTALATRAAVQPDKANSLDHSIPFPQEGHQGGRTG